MAKCIDCNGFTKFTNGYCSSCYDKRKEKGTLKISKKELKSRKKSTPEALRLFDALKQKGVSALLEKWDGHKHIDISIPESKINIEIDGLQHNYKSKQALADLKRTYYSFLKNWVTLRIPNSLIKNNLDETVNLIIKFLNVSAEQLEAEIKKEE